MSALTAALWHNVSPVTRNPSHTQHPLSTAIHTRAEYCRSTPLPVKAAHGGLGEVIKPLSLLRPLYSSLLVQISPKPLRQVKLDQTSATEFHHHLKAYKETRTTLKATSSNFLTLVS